MPGLNLIPGGLAVAAPVLAPDWAGERPHSYDPVRNVYNWKPSNTRKLRASLGAAQAGVGLSHWFCVGDSGTENTVGGSGQYAHAQMWPEHLRKTLVAMGAAIDGGLSVHLGTTQLAANDPRIVRTSGTWTNYAWSIGSSSASATLTFVATGTAIDVAYSNYSGGFTVTATDVNGGAPVAVSGNATDTTGHYTVTGLPEATRTITVTRTSGQLIVFGISSYRASGLMVDNLGASGTSAQQWAAAGTGIAEGRQFFLPAGTTPSAVFIALGANDIATRTQEQIKTDILAVRSKFPAGDVIIVGHAQPAGDSTGLWETLGAVGYDVADELDCPYVDTLDRVGPYAVASTNGIYGNDNIHGSIRYQADLGRSLATLAAT